MGLQNLLWIEAVKAAEKLEQLIKLTHALKRIITDRGKAFVSMEIREFCKKYNTKHVINSIVSSRSGTCEPDGMVIGTVTCIRQKRINSTVNATTGLAPSELLYGIRPKVENEVRLVRRERQDFKVLGKGQRNAVMR